MKKLSFGLTVVFATLLFSTLFNSCKLKPELVVEAADGSGTPQDNLSFPVFSLKSLEYTDLIDKMVVRVMDDIMLVIDPNTLAYKAYGISIDNIDRIKVSPSGLNLLVVSKLSNGQNRIIAWNTWDKEFFIDESFNGDIVDIDWHPNGENILIAGKMDTSTTNTVYQMNSSGRIWDATSYLVRIPTGYRLSGNGVTEIDCGGYRESIYFAIELDYSSTSTTPSLFALVGYDTDSGWKESLDNSYSFRYSDIEVSEDEGYLLYKQDGQRYYYDLYWSRDHQLSNTAVLNTGSGLSEYDIDASDQYIFSVLPNSKSFLKYDLLNDYGTNISLGIEEAIDIRDLHFVK